MASVTLSSPVSGIINGRSAASSQLSSQSSSVATTAATSPNVMAFRNLDPSKPIYVMGFNGVLTAVDFSSLCSMNRTCTAIAWSPNIFKKEVVSDFLDFARSNQVLLVDLEPLWLIHYGLNTLLSVPVSSIHYFESISEEELVVDYVKIVAILLRLGFTQDKIFIKVFNSAALEEMRPLYPQVHCHCTSPVDRCHVLDFTGTTGITPQPQEDFVGAIVSPVQAQAPELTTSPSPLPIGSDLHLPVSASIVQANAKLEAQSAALRSFRPLSPTHQRVIRSVSPTGPRTQILQARAGSFQSPSPSVSPPSSPSQASQASQVSTSPSRSLSSSSALTFGDDYGAIFAGSARSASPRRLRPPSPTSKVLVGSTRQNNGNVLLNAATANSPKSSQSPRSFLSQTERRILVTPYECGVHQEKNEREYMEDVYLFDSNFMTEKQRGLYAVFDGHSGIGAAKFVAEQLPPMLRKYLSSGRYDVAQCLVRSFHELDRMLKNNGESSGTTALVLVVQNEGNKRVIYAANVGDCRALIGGDGHYDVLSNDHTIEKNRGEQERIRKIAHSSVDENGYVSDTSRGSGSLIPTRTLGDHPVNPDKDIILCTPEISRTEITPSDEVLVLATDGLWDTMTNMEAMRISIRDVQAQTPLNTIAKTLVMESIRKRSSDNITALVVRLR